MNQFPATAEEFYTLRDDRTNRCVATRRYQAARCLVTIDEALLNTFTGQVMLVTTCNLLSRWCRSVRVVCPQVSAHPLAGRGERHLKDAILTQMQDADPFGDFDFASEDKGHAEIQLHIGSDLRAVAPMYAVITASGWYATLSKSGPISLPTSNDENCLGAIAAACLGVAQVFKYAIQSSNLPPLSEGVFDLFTLRRLKDDERIEVMPFAPAPNLGRMLMVGAGSVGSAAAYCLRALNASGDLMIVENDIVKIENFNRSPIFGKHCFAVNKAEAVAMSLGNSNINVQSFPGWWDDFIKAHGRKPHAYDIWFPLANEFGVRWSMQNNVPPLMVHASTTANWGVNHARHIPSKDDCLADRFPESVQKESLECSTSTIAMPEAAVDAALPFLSLFGGLLIAAELARLQIDGYPHAPNFAHIDFGGSLDHVQAWDKKARADCICKDHSKELHKTLNGETMYAQLSL
jgi:hypothetical protein